MGYRCKICDLLITHEDLLDPEWCCGRCDMDDWIDERPNIDDGKTIVIESSTYDLMVYEITRLNQIVKDQDKTISELKKKQNRRMRLMRTNNGI